MPQGVLWGRPRLSMGSPELGINHPPLNRIPRPSVNEIFEPTGPVWDSAQKANHDQTGFEIKTPPLVPKFGQKHMKFIVLNISVSKMLWFLWFLEVREGLESSGRLIGRISSCFRPDPT